MGEEGCPQDTKARKVTPGLGCGVLTKRSASCPCVHGDICKTELRLPLDAQFAGRRPTIWDPCEVRLTEESNCNKCSDASVSVDDYIEEAKFEE